MTIKVLHVNTEKRWRGGERQVYLQLKYADREFENILCCRTDSALAIRTREDLGVPMYSLPLKNGIDTNSAWKIARFCKKSNVLILHCHTPKALSLGYISKLFGNPAKLLFTKRTNFPIRSNLFTQWKYKIADLIICVSKSAEKVVKESLPNSKTIVISSAIELHKERTGEKLMDFSRFNHKKLVGYVAALTSEKNPEVFIEVAKQVIQKRRDVLFLWIGEGVLKSDLQKKVKEEDMEEHILFPGFQKNIFDWMQQLDVLFFPSKLEGFPTTILDAMQCKVPVVASDVGGIPEMIINNQNGFLVDPENKERFTSRIIQLLQDQNLKTRFVNESISRLPHYNIENVIIGLEKTYKKVIEC